MISGFKTPMSRHQRAPRASAWKFGLRIAPVFLLVIVLLQWRVLHRLTDTPVTTDLDVMELEPSLDMELIETQAEEHFEHDFSHTGTVELPNFASDYSEFVLGSILERESETFNLFLTTFFVCHSAFEGNKGGGLTRAGGLKILKGREDEWQTAFRKMEPARGGDHKYWNNGLRKQHLSDYYCRLSHIEQAGKSGIDGYSHPPYNVNGTWLPNKVTVDSNSNKRMDIFRCPMEGGEAAYKHLARHPTAHLRVDIVRRGRNEREEEHVISYSVPWLTRVAGLASTTPPTPQKRPRVYSTLDAWKGYDPDRPGHWHHDSLYLCVAGIESPPSKSETPLLVEWIEHHLQLGAAHLLLYLSFSWNSPHMHLFQRLFKQNIDTGKVSMASGATDGIDMAVSTQGLLWARDNIKIWQVNMCSYVPPLF